MFHSARLKLTVWYTFIAVIITIFFSIIVYSAFNVEFERGLVRQRIVFQQQLPDGPTSFSIRRPDPSVTQEVRNRFLERMILIDLLIIMISAVTGYFFAGRTLLPLKKMVDEQNRFITDASHELRTPLTAAKTSVEVGLRDKKLTLTQARDLLTSNLEEINTMQKLADKLLLLAQVENGNTKKGYAPISVKTSILTAREKVSSLAKEKNITISLIGEDVEIAADKESIVEFFVILFDNAIKYSEKEMNITVSSEKSDSMGIIKVQDHGVGIDEKDLPHIFDRFYRAEKSRTKTKASGYGLGLSIAKKIVDEHHGTISVESTFGQGTTFTIKLPKRQRHSA